MAQVYVADDTPDERSAVAAAAEDDNKADGSKYDSALEIHRTSVANAESAKGGLCSYLLDIGFLIIVSAIGFAPPLFVPVEDPAEGILPNSGYYFAYNGYIGFFLSYSTWRRLSKIIVRKGARGDAKPFAVEITLRNPKTWVLMCCAYIVTTTTFVLCGLAWKERMAVSYAMVYCAPVTMAAIDFIFYFFWLPQRERNKQTFGIVFNYDGLCGMPILLIFVPIFMKMYFAHAVTDVVVPVIVIPLLKIGLNAATHNVLTKDVQACKLDGAVARSGLELYFECLVNVALVMLYPGSKSALILVGVIVAELGLMQLSLWRFDRAARSKEAGGAPVNKVGGPSPSGGAGSLAWRAPSADARAQAVAQLDALPNEALTLLRQRAMAHFTTLAVPVVFSVAILIIVRYRNTDHYYLYECFDDRLLERAITFALIQFGAQLVIVFVEVFQYRRRGMSASMLLACQSRLWEDAEHSVTALIFAMCIYTSCFFVKHDGIQILEQLGDGLGKCA